MAWLDAFNREAIRRAWCTSSVQLEMSGDAAFMACGRIPGSNPFLAQYQFHESLQRLIDKAIGRTGGVGFIHSPAGFVIGSHLFP